MTVRNAKKSDKEAVLNLLDEFRADCIEQITGEKGFSETAIKGGSKIFDELLSDDKYHLSVLVNDEKNIVGVITGYLCPMLRSGQFRAEVEEFFIKKDQRGAGGANKLMDSFFAWCRSNNVTKVNLESHTMLIRAHTFYEKYGFQTDAKRFVKKLK